MTMATVLVTVGLILLAGVQASTITPSMADRFLHATMNAVHRQLQEGEVPQACLDDRQALANNTDLQSASDAVAAEYETALTACTGDLVPSEGFKCELDEDTFDSAPGYVKACQTADGVVYQFNGIVACRFTFQGNSILFQVKVKNANTCEAASCKGVTLDPEQVVSESIATLEDELEGFASNELTVNCESTLTIRNDEGTVVYGSGASRTTSLSMLATLVSVGVVAVVFV